MSAYDFDVVVFLEDTDAQGVVYHTNYLKYCERARSDILMQAGFRLADLQASGCTLVVHEMSAKFHRPARLHDELVIRTTPRKSSEYRLTFEQLVLRSDEPKPLLVANVSIVAIGPDGNLVPMPEALLEGISL